MKTPWKIVLGIVGFLILLSVFNNIKSCSAENEKESNMNFKPALASKEIKCSNSLINGELGNYLEIKDDKAIINFVGIVKNFSNNKYIQNWEVKVCIKRNNKPLPFEVKNLSGNSGINIQLLNSNASPISNLDEINGFDISIDELLSLKAGENKWVTFTFGFGESQIEDVIKDINFFILNSKIDFIEKSSPEAIIDVEENKDDLDRSLKAAEKATELMERQVKMAEKIKKMDKEK